MDGPFLRYGKKIYDLNFPALQRKIKKLLKFTLTTSTGFSVRRMVLVGWAGKQIFKFFAGSTK